MVASIDSRVQRVADALADLLGVVAITLGGSAAAGLADGMSDFDVYVYWRAPLASPDERAERLQLLADDNSLQMNILTWGLEDHLRVGGTLIELVYLDLDGLQAEVERAYSDGLISEGYTTSFLYTLAHNHVLHDATGEVTALRERLNAAYPEPTRDKLLRYHPELMVFYLSLLRRAQQRDDLLFVQQERSVIQAIFFNLLFALNRLYHPGEKRLLVHAGRCAIQPPNLGERWNNIARLAADNAVLGDALEALVDDLCKLIETHR